MTFQKPHSHKHAQNDVDAVACKTKVNFIWTKNFTFTYCPESQNWPSLLSSYNFCVCVQACMCVCVFAILLTAKWPSVAPVPKTMTPASECRSRTEHFWGSSTNDYSFQEIVYTCNVYSVIDGHSHSILNTLWHPRFVSFEWNLTMISIQIGYKILHLARPTPRRHQPKLKLGTGTTTWSVSQFVDLIWIRGRQQSDSGCGHPSRHRVHGVRFDENRITKKKTFHTRTVRKWERILDPCHGNKLKI